MAVGNTIFEALGFSYLGPIDGHDLNQLLPIFRTVQKRLDGPILLHVVTKKEKGMCQLKRQRIKVMLWKI